GIPREQGIDASRPACRHIAVRGRSEDDIPLEPGVRRRPAQTEDCPGVGLNDVVAEYEISRAQSTCPGGHDDALIVIDQGIERDSRPVGPVVARQRSSIGDLAVAVADLDAWITVLEVVAINLVVVAEEA